MSRTTAQLLEVWRAAERAAVAAKQTAEAALAAADAAEGAAVAARAAASQAGLSLDATTDVRDQAHTAYAERQDEMFGQTNGAVGTRHD